MAAGTPSWQPDPYGLHEWRFFSADGKPTLLVMDGGTTSYDRPPAGPPPAPDRSVDAQAEGTQASMLARDPSEVQRASESASSSALLVATVEPTGVISGSASAPARLVATIEPIGAIFGPAPTPLVATVEPTGAISGSREPPDSGSASGTRRTARPAVPGVGALAGYRTNVVDTDRHEGLSRTLKITYIVIFAVLALSVLGLAYVHLRPKDGHSAHAGGTATASRTRTTSEKAVTTTTAIPASLSPNAEAAASALVSDWSTGNKAGALTVATPASVATLFAVPYTSGLAIARGCSTDFSPIVCTYGPPGGASPSDAIYQILVTQTAGGWYVSTVRVQSQQ